MEPITGAVQNAYFSYLFVDIIALGLSLFITYKIRNIMGGTKQRLAFYGLMFFFIVFLILDMFWSAGFYRMLPFSPFVLADFESWTFWVAVCTAYFWSQYVEARCDIQWKRPAAVHISHIIPALFLMVLTIISPFTGSLYRVLPDGSIALGPFYVFSILVGLYYLLCATVLTALYAIRNRGRARYHEYLILTLFGLLPVLALILDIYITGTPIVALSMFASIFFIFINEQDSQVNHDALTGLVNRRRALEYFESNLSHVSQENPLFVYMIDANYFKEINDHFGHNEGDRALQTIASAFTQTIDSNRVLISRWGGDEFLITGFPREIGDADHLAAQIAENLAALAGQKSLPYLLTISIGIARIDDPSLAISSIIAAADQTLYKKKQESHSEEARQAVIRRH